MTVTLFEVGGSIRDTFLGVESDDRDFIAVCSDWNTFLDWCNTKMKKVFMKKEEHLTVRGMMACGQAIDIVMVHSNHENPWQDCWDDLLRRDFTINAMAQEVDPETLERTGWLIDPCGGKGHLEIKKLVQVGQNSIWSDKVRLLRAIRFAIKFDLEFFPQVKMCLESKEAWRQLMKQVPEERVRQELAKCLKLDTAKTMQMLAGFEGAIESLFSGGIWLSPTVTKK